MVLQKHSFVQYVWYMHVWYNMCLLHFFVALYAPILIIKIWYTNSEENVTSIISYFYQRIPSRD